MLQWGWTELLVTLTRQLLLLGAMQMGLQPDSRASLCLRVPHNITQSIHLCLWGNRHQSDPKFASFQSWVSPRLTTTQRDALFYSKKRAEYWKGALPNRWEREWLNCDLTGGKKGVSKQQGWRVGPTECLVWCPTCCMLSQCQRKLPG